MNIKIPPKKFSQLAKESIIQKEKTPLLLSDWLKVVFLHFKVDRQLLQSQIPFELELYNGEAYVSLVAFSLRRLRPSFGGKITEILSGPVANHEYLNVRTYVKHKGEAGIYFIDEWLSKKLCVLFGKAMYGLPYRHGKLIYQNDYKERYIAGYINPYDLDGQFIYKSNTHPAANFETFQPNTLGEFLAERYIAFAGKKKNLRSFRVWHEPWQQYRIYPTIEKNTLLPNIGQWGKTAELIEAYYSPGCYDVWIGKPNYVYGSYLD